MTNTATPSSSSSLQEGDGVRKSGQITLLGIGKKGAKTQQAYAVLSERALELHESEKSHRKKKSARSIVDLSKCFNVSQQNCPRSKAACICLLMPDEFFMFRGENTNKTTEWYGTLLSAVISARALHLGRPVFANEFFESVWDVTVCPQQPKLKRIPAPPNTTEFANSLNICAKLPELSGRKRICFYPHTIIICKVGIEPAHSGNPKSGIPPFRTVDFVEFSRHFIAQFGPVDKYFLMRIGRSSPMGSCEVWVQCDTEEGAAEITRKLQEIIQRETEKKEQALMAIRGQQQQQQQFRHGQLANATGQMPTNSCSASASLYSLSCGTAVDSAGPNAAAERMSVDKSDSLTFTIDQQLEPISEDEALAIQPVTECKKKHSSLSQSAKEKRLELRECKAKVDSLEEEEQRFQQRQMQMAQQQQMDSGWIGGGGGGGGAKRYTAISKGSDNPDVCQTGASIVNTRPTCLMGQPTYQFRRRGSSGGTMATEIGARSKSLSLEEQQAQCFRPFVGGGRLWTMDKADSLLLLGYGPPETEETEDSGGTLRMIPLDQEDGSQAASRSSSSLNLTTQMGNGMGSHSSSAAQLVETYVECHVPCGINDDEEEHEDEDTDSTEDEGAVGAKNKRKSRRKLEMGGKKDAASAQRRRQKHRQLDDGDLESGGGSLDGGAEADQSCSCSSSVASSSGHDDQQGLIDEQNNNTNIANRKSTTHQAHRSQQHQFDHHQQSPQNVEYTLMDKVSCSSDSFSHLAVPQPNNNNNNGSWAPLDGRSEEICSYTSDSGDSCYSSMVNGQLNPRAFSFSSAASERAAHHFGTGKLGGATQQQPQQHPAAAKWTAAMGHRNYLFHQPSAHFSPPKNHHGGSNGGNHQQTQRNPSSIQLDSSSSSRFSMETSLITPLEEDERQVTFADEEQRDRLGKAAPRSSVANCEEADDLLRKRAFSLGSKSWITKPFRKLSSAHGTPSNGRQQRSSCGGASRSGSSSLVGSMHADLCSVQEQSSQPHLAYSSHRLGSSSSFASSSAAGPINDGHHTRSDSVGSSHSAALSLPGHHSQRRTTNKNHQSLEKQLKNEDLVELEFMPAERSNVGKCLSSLSNPYSNRSQQCVATLSATTPISCSSADARNSPLRGRTNSCDDYNTMSTLISGGSYYHHQQQQQKAMANTMMMGAAGDHSPFGGTPRGRGSAGALNHQGGDNGGHHHQQQRLRPSESFIRSIQQQQREIQRARNQQKPRQRLKTDFPLQEVQCFIAPAERDKIDAITARDTLSLRSQRSGSGSCSQQFETIEEGQQGTSQSRRSLTAKPATLNEEQSLETISGSGGGGNDESDYIFSEPKKTAVKA